jgi:glutamate-1-semialdehyde 2,1-aminomutase
MPTSAYLDDASRSKQLYERALSVMPGGNSRHTVVMKPYPVYAVSGQGCRVTDVEGEERIDFVNNYTSLIRGHADPAATEAVAAVIRRGTAFSLPTETDIRLAELLVDRIPCIDQIRFCNSGSEAVLLALRAARAATGRAKIAKFEGCYHGIYDYAQASDSSRPANWGDLERPATTLETSMSPRVGEDVITMPYNRPDVCRALIEENAEDLAAVLIDPLPAALGLLSPAEGFLGFLREITERHGVLLVADEVLSFRVDYTGACHQHGVEPDLVALGKIIGGGFPVGAVAGKTKVMEVFDHRIGEKVHHGGTYNGNPVTMVAGYEVMRQMTEDEYGRLNANGDSLREKLHMMLEARGLPHQVNGRGSLFSILLTDDPAADFRDVSASRGAHPQLVNLVHEMLARGILLGSRGLFGALSTPMEQEDLDAFVVALDESLEALGVS